jgi:GNAT superfamily N-acetyltransferase
MGQTHAGRLTARLNRVRRAFVGRACRYRLGRRLLGASDQEAADIGLLGPGSIGPWEDYLRVPRGTLRLPGPGIYSVVAVSRARIVGHVTVLRQWDRPDVQVPGWWLTGLEVVPEWRGRAVGAGLVQGVVGAWEAREPAQDLFLVVRRRNIPAIGLFESAGFRAIVEEEWERRLARVYPARSGGSWSYQIMKRPARECLASC